MSSKSAAVYLIDPLNAPEPSQETGPGTHFGNTLASVPAAKSSSKPSGAGSSANASPSSNNPFRDDAGRHAPPQKTGASVSARPVREGGDAAPRRRAGTNTNSPPSYDEIASSSSNPNQRHRRTSSLKERFPGDDSHKPLEMIRKDSQRARRSPHLSKRHQPGPDIIDRLDPALGGKAYHHEGPYDAALLARNTSYETSPLAALQTSNAEALKATPAENIKDAVERHKPLDGVAAVPPGMQDRFGRTYNYEEGADVMHEDNPDGPGYKRYAGEEYDPEDLKGQGPTYSLDRALQAHKIDDNGIEMEDHAKISKDYHRAQRKGTLDTRDPVNIAGDDGKYVDMEVANARANATESDLKGTGGFSSLKKRIGSLRHKKHND